MSIKINSFEIEGVKRIKAVSYAPSENGLTVIGGKNGAGKTSVLDAIAWALGGERYRPSNAAHDGDYNPPHLKVTLSDGITVERSGKNSSLKVTDSKGNRCGQALLDAFIEDLALNLPKFMAASDKEKAETLLRIIGVGDTLAEYERKEKQLYDERHQIGRLADQKAKYAAELPHYDGVPLAPVSAIDLIHRQQEILAINGENRRKREHVASLEKKRHELEKQLADLSEQLSAVINDLNIAKLSAEALEDQSTAELERDIAAIDTLNIQIRANLDRERAYDEAAELREKYDALTGEIDDIRTKRLALLANADLPLPELSVENGELTYRGKKWDCLSGAEQLKVSAAIVRKLKPECGFVLMDKLEQMDLDTLAAFGEWLESEGLQVIATRVSIGDECDLIIEDGRAFDKNPTGGTPVGIGDGIVRWDSTVAGAPPQQSGDSTPAWREGRF